MGKLACGVVVAVLKIEKGLVMAKQQQKTKNQPTSNSHIQQQLCENINTSLWKYYLIACPFILGCCTLFFYWPSRYYEFQFDDVINIVRNYDLRHHSFGALFFSCSRWLVFWINAIHYQLNKYNPITYRLTNIVQHILIGCMLFYFLMFALNNLKKKSFFKEYANSIALLTTVLFLLHPVQTQTVSYVIQGQMEGLVSFFLMIMALSFYVLCQTKSMCLCVICVLIYVIALLCACSSKEIALVIPCLMFLIDWFLIAQGSWCDLKKRIFFHILSFSCVVGCFTYFFRLQFFYKIFGLQWTAPNNLGNVLTSGACTTITPYAYCISQFKVILHYAGIFVWPFNMSVEYDWVLSRGFFAIDCLAPFCFLVALCALIFYLLKKDAGNIVCFGLIWFFICVLPRSSIVPSSELIADYKTYAASIGVLFLIASTLIFLMQLIARTVPKLVFIDSLAKGHAVVACLLVVCLGGATMGRNTIWRSGLEFWGDMVKNAPGKARVHNNYGVELSQKLRKYEESIPYFKRAIAMDPSYSDPHNNLSVAYAFLGHIDLAIEEMERSLAINPGYAEGYNNLAAFLLEKKEYEKAEKYLNIAIKIRSSYGKPYVNRAKMYFEQGKIDLALKDLKSACTKADLDNEFGFKMYGRFALEHKAWDDALFAFKKLVDTKPQDPECYVGLGHAYNQKQQYDKAIVCFERALQLDPNNGRFAFFLAEVYCKLGNFARALTYFEKINILQVPQVGLHIAKCHEQLGNFQKAQHVYTSMLALQLPSELRSAVQEAHDKLMQTT